MLAYKSNLPCSFFTSHISVLTTKRVILFIMTGDSVKELHAGYMAGVLQNTYFLPSKWKKEFRLYQAVHKPLFGRDFPVAWRDIDRLELPTSSQ
jgi:hypothetical protein